VNHRERVQAALDHRGDGGYVFCAAHNLQPDVTPDRIDVMYRTALEHRRTTLPS